MKLLAEHARSFSIEDEPDAEVEEGNELDDTEVRSLGKPEDYRFDDLMQKVQQTSVNIGKTLKISRFSCKIGAGDEARTRDPLLGKQMLYH